MMRLCGFLLLAACSADPTLDISVHHPDGYGVTQTSVTVYFGNDISCSEIEFDDRTDAELVAIAVAQVDVAEGERERVEVSRLGGKSFVARGFDDQHRYVTAGCKDIGEITDGTKVKIDTQPTAVVAIDPGQPELPFSARTILVNMSDINGMPIDGTVSWQLTGPAGAPEQPPSAGVATKSGNAKIHVDDLGTPGPEGLRIRAPWATTRLPLVTGFDLSHAILLQLGGGNVPGGHPSCDIRGHAGKPSTLVCLNQPSGLQNHRDVVEFTWQTDHYAMTTIPIAGIDNQFALFVDHDGSADEPVYVISGSGSSGNWYKLGAPGTGTTTPFDGTPTNIVYVPRCQANQFNPAIALVAVQTQTTVLGINFNKVQIFNTTGGTVVGSQPHEVFSGGCVADVDKNEHQAIVLSDGSVDASAALFLTTPNPASQMSISGSKLTGSGFIAAETQGMLEKRFAGTRLQATGTVVFEAVLALESSAYKLIERSEVESAAPPAKIIGGKFDQDGDTDLMWDMIAGARKRVFQVSLAKHVSGVPLTAMTSGTVGTAATAMADFIAGNLNGGMTDELVLFSASAVTIYSADP